MREVNILNLPENECYLLCSVFNAESILIDINLPKILCTNFSTYFCETYQFVLNDHIFYASTGKCNSLILNNLQV